MELFEASIITSQETFNDSYDSKRLVNVGPANDMVVRNNSMA
jgi:hypothetical protein